MLIEGSTTRLAIDLLESLRKRKLTAVDIRVSYINKRGLTVFKTFKDLDSLKEFYIKKYNKTVTAKRSPFTKDKRKAQLVPIIKDGLIIGNEPIALNTGSASGLCELGDFVSLERFKLISDTFNFHLEYNCTDVSDNYSIKSGLKRDNNRNKNRQAGMLRQKAPISNLFNDYKKILENLYKSYIANLYVDLCYVEVGYVEESVRLYSLFFALIKAPINAGLRLSVLEPQYLKKSV